MFMKMSWPILSLKITANAPENWRLGWMTFPFWVVYQPVFRGEIVSFSVSQKPPRGFEWSDCLKAKGKEGVFFHPIFCRFSISTSTGPLMWTGFSCGCFCVSAKEESFLFSAFWGGMCRKRISWHIAKKYRHVNNRMQSDTSATRRWCIQFFCFCSPSPAR